MPVCVRDATLEDAAELVAILNPIIEDGTTTAHRTLFDQARMIAHYIAPVRAISCKLAMSGSAVVGFQTLEWADPDWAGPDPVPVDWAVIATFVRQGSQARGIGTALFAATRNTARRAGPATIDATIRADNAPTTRRGSRIMGGWGSSTTISFGPSRCRTAQGWTGCVSATT